MQDSTPQPAPRHQRILEHYAPRVVPGRDSFDILDWGSKQEQLLRFAVLVDLLHREEDRGHSWPGDASLLDVGCGLADLRDYLRDPLPGVRYTGVDITPQILREARRRQPAARLVLGDIFGAEPFHPRCFDVVFCSGVFNLDLGNNTAFLSHALPMLLSLSRRCLAVNFLHERAPVKYRHCCYFSPGEIADIVRSEGADVEIVDHYLEKDFTLFARQRSGGA